MAKPPTGTTAVGLGQIVNERPRPRVLVTGFEQDAAEAVRSIAADVAPTVTVALYLPSIDLSEYDCVITGDEYLHLEEETHPRAAEHLYRYKEPPTRWKWWQKFPPHMPIFRILDGSQKTNPVVDMLPAQGQGEDLNHEIVYVQNYVPGTHVRYAQGLPADISELVKRHLVARAQAREHHITITVREVQPAEGETEPPADASSFVLRPLLYGPSNQILAATYERSTEASVWLLPLDLIGDLRAWLVAAFREWHRLYPQRFPAVADWARAAEWATPAERELLHQIQDADNALEKARAEHEATVASLDEALSVARVDGDTYERALLTGTGTQLETAVSRALTELGFVVQEMDETWPADARREDFRISDPDEPGWLALGEAKGFTKGVSESGLMNLMKYVAMYITEERRTPQRQWYITNYFLHEDPATRPHALNGRDDVIDTFADASGLIIDTRDLFALLAVAHQQPEWKAEIRESMRRQTGRFAVPTEPSTPSE